MAKSSLVMPEFGTSNANLDEARARLMRGGSYRDQSTVIVCPTRGQNSATGSYRTLSPKVVTSWFGLIRPMNQQIVGPLFIVGDEVGEAYCNAVELILNHPQLRRFRYLLTLEDDVVTPPDGLMKLLESIEAKELGGPYDVVGGLYWTKGEGQQPMCYGPPGEVPKNFRPFLPPPTVLVQRANGLGMGFNLFRLSMFRNEKLAKPWFKTLQRFTPGVGAEVMTQDLYFYRQASPLGYRFACDTRVRCGHYDDRDDRVW